MKLEVTEHGVRQNRQPIEKGSVIEVPGDEIPASLIGKVRRLDGGKTAKTPVTNPAEGAVPGYEAKHRGGGRYSVMNGDAEVMSGLSKDDAEAFNGLSDDEKAEYLKAEAE